MFTQTAASTASPAARYFALRPIFSERVTQHDVPVAGLTADGVLSDRPSRRSYAGVEPTAWARRVLVEVDRVMSSAFGTGPGAVPNSLFARELARVAAARDLLASTLVTQVRPVFVSCRTRP